MKQVLALSAAFILIASHAQAFMVYSNSDIQMPTYVKADFKDGMLCKKGAKKIVESDEFHETTCNCQISLPLSANYAWKCYSTTQEATLR